MTGTSERSIRRPEERKLDSDMASLLSLGKGHDAGIRRRGTDTKSDGPDTLLALSYLPSLTTPTPVQTKDVCRPARGRPDRDGFEP